MDDPRTRRRFAAALLLAALLPPAAAEAVIPSAFGPIQALIVILPQLLVALAAAAVALFKPRTYRLLFAYLWSHKAFSAVLAGFVSLLAWSPWSGSSGAAAAEEVGAPWAAFRGGPQRTGAVAGAQGPLVRPFVPWKIPLGATSAVDSSPAIVGNRVYVGVSYQSAFGAKSGAILCADAGSGAVAWQWDGRGELSPPLMPVFSSPAVWVEKGPGDPAPAARWLVSGEGYHEDRDCRIVCLDLEPARKPGGTPRLAWSVQTTSHVESAPCIFDGKVYIGAGDDGVWCVELASGRVLWRLEGAPSCAVDGPRAGALSELEGKTVVARGPVRREGLGVKGKDDPGELVIDVREFKEHAGAPVTSSDSGRTFERTVTGRVARKDGRVRLETGDAYPDSESPPIGALLGRQPVVVFGSGIGGQRVNCVDARTGSVLWWRETPYPAFGAPTVAGDRVLIGVGNGNFIVSDPNPAGAILCLALRDGRELWRVPTPDTVIGAVAVHQGRAYACCRDGQVYAIDLEKGEAAAKYALGSPMVCSPAVTAEAIYVTTEAGKLLCLDRGAGSVRWAQTLTGGTMIVSSPAVAAGRVFVGTRSKGLFAISERPASADAGPPRPWIGPGGNAGRNGCADDRGLPRIEGDTADLRWPTSEALAGSATGPVAARGGKVYAALGDRLVLVDAATGAYQSEVRRTGPIQNLVVDGEAIYFVRGGPHGPELRSASHRNGHPGMGGGGLTLGAGALACDGDRLYQITAKGKLESSSWQASLGELVGSPAVAHGLVVVAVKGTPGRLVCLSDASGAALWTTELDAAPADSPSISGDKILVACAGKGAKKGFLECRKIVDGSLVWRKELDDAALSYPVASAEWVVVATADDKIAAFKAADGQPIDPVLVGGKPAIPALWKDTLVVAGEERIAAYDLSSREWLWNYKDQDNIGTVVGQPVILDEVIWVGTTKKGLLAIGAPK